MVEDSLTRRDFLKKALLATAGIAVGAYGINQILHCDSAPVSQGSPLWKWSREAYHYVSREGTVYCQVCPNGCILREGQQSVCRTKINYEGTFYTLAYGNPCAVHIDPIEKKPLFHFLPATHAFSIATAGCNLRCLNCQNWEISQRSPEETYNGELFPPQVVDRARAEGCSSIAYTYSEPTAWYEYMYDTARLAMEGRVHNVWVTNGYMNEDPLRDLCQYLHAANVDVKSFSEDVYQELNSGHLEPVLNTLQVLKEEGIWVEITNLVIPSWTDDLNMIEDMCKWIYSSLGPGYPLHFSRFHPQYKLLQLPPTPYETLQKARNLALDIGLHYVYIGNIPGAEEINTFCPHCGKCIIERRGFTVDTIHLQQGTCAYCGESIPGMWDNE